MKNYIKQLIAILEKVDPQPNVETPANINRKASERDLHPLKSIEEWTGIEQIVFPSIERMTLEEVSHLNIAIEKVIDSLNLNLVDKPEDIPPEKFYTIITNHWQDKVQYLPSSGMDWELCSGDPTTCAWGAYCNCGEESWFSRGEVPEKYRKAVKEIAEFIDAGLVCFFNPLTMELEQVVPELEGEPELFEDTVGEKWEDCYKYESWEHCLRFEQPASRESFKIMEQFAGTVPDAHLRQQLYNALDRKRPFANFKDIIDNSDYREKWFAFKQSQMEEIVWDEMQYELPSSDK